MHRIRENKTIKRITNYYINSLYGENSKINEDKEKINFSQKKRQRENYNPPENKKNILSQKINILSKKFLTFEKFQNKIRDQLLIHKAKRNDFLSKNINFPIFSPKSSNKNIFLLENDFNTSIINNDLKKMDKIKNINNNKSKNYKNENFIYQTNKKLNIKENKNIDNYINSSKQKLLVSVYSPKNKNNENENDIFNISIKDLNNFPIYRNGKKGIKQIIISLISGIVIIGFVYFTSNDIQSSEIKNALNCFSLSSWIKICCFIVIVILIFLIYYKNKEIFTCNKIALEDFELLKKLLYDNYLGNKEEYIGLFQNQFTKDCSKSRNISESKYIKYILPIIYKNITEFNEKVYKIKHNNEIANNLIIEENDVIISGQKMKLWKYNKLSNI